MQTVMCLEVLLATVALWVALFGICDLLLENIKDNHVKLGFYMLLMATVFMFVYYTQQIDACTLM